LYYAAHTLLLLLLLLWLLQVDTVWDVREVDDHCTIKVQAEVKMPSMIKFVAKKIEASVLAQGKSFAQQMIADMVAKEHDKETDR
jgi:hypothetical protein